MRLRIGLLAFSVLAITSVLVACIFIYEKSEQVKQDITDRASVTFAVIFVIEFILISVLVSLLTYKLY